MAVDYGRDLSCVDDLNPTMSEVEGRRLLAEAIARRLTTPRGDLLDDPNYGYDVTDFVNDDLGPRDISLIQTNIVAECLKDERVIGCTALVSLTAVGVLSVVVGLEDVEGPFPLVLAINDVTATILKVGE